jgi:hypothetical protein
MGECVGRDRRTGRCGRRRCNAAGRQAACLARAEGKWQRSRSEQPSVRIGGPHIRMMTEKRSKGNLDPSRAWAPAGADTSVAGRDGPGVLPDFAGGGGWHSAVVGVGLGRGRRGCNSTVRDHSANRSRTRRGIRCHGKPADGEPLRHESPCRPQAGMDKGNRLWQVRTSFDAWWPAAGLPSRNPAVASGGVPHADCFPAFDNEVTPAQARSTGMEPCGDVAGKTPPGGIAGTVKRDSADCLRRIGSKAESLSG